MRSLADGFLILGMHRSGTSAVAGCLERAGLDFSGPLMAAKTGENSRGYFELLAAYDAHKSLFARCSVAWDDPRGLDLTAVRQSVLDDAVDELEALLVKHFKASKAWALKDPRLSRTAPLWHRALERLGADARHVIVLRHPDEVAASLAVRDGFSREKSDLLWAEHMLDAERHSRGRRRAVVDYRQLLDDPIDAVGKLGDRLHFAWPRSGARAHEAISHFLDRGLRHHRGKAIQARGRLGDLLPRLHRELLDVATSGREPDRELFDTLDAQLQGRRRQLQSLEIEHMTQLALRGEQQTEDLSDWIEQQSDDIKELRGLVHDLEDQLAERTRWLQIQDKLLHDQLRKLNHLESKLPPD
ncbi:MAG: sulfotransferase [Acidobacteriota bacterium]